MNHIKCKTCNAEIMKSTSRCPQCGTYRITSSVFCVMVIVSLVMLAIVTNIIRQSDDSSPVNNTGKIEPYKIYSGDVFEPGAYIDIADVHVVYNGDFKFSITNNTEDIIMIILTVVGVKKDGSSELLQVPAFNGMDEAQYKQDESDNGWAVPNYTNKVRPNDTLAASVSIVNFGKEYLDPDIDGDGYYDLVFTIYPQESMDHASVSTDSPKSEVYKLPVNG